MDPTFSHLFYPIFLFPFRSRAFTDTPVCLADCLSRRLFSLIFQVSLVFVLGTLDSSFRQQDRRRVFSGNARTEGGGGGGGGGFPGLVGSCTFSSFYQFGIMAWN